MVKIIINDFAKAGLLVELSSILSVIFSTYKSNLIIVNSPDALEKNHEIEFERNKERFLFLKVSYCNAVCCILIGWSVYLIAVGC